MKTNKVETLIDSFVNPKTGKVHYVVIAAVSKILEKETWVCDYYGEDVTPVKKSLTFGISICNPIDEFNGEIGKKIAIGRAMKKEEADLYVVDPGMIYTDMVKFLLERKMKFIKDNPSEYIAAFRK